MSVNVIDWDKAISKNKSSVVKFATNKTSSSDFKRDFAGVPNTAAFAVSHHGALYARRLSRKALRHRGLLK